MIDYSKLEYREVLVEATNHVQDNIPLPQGLVSRLVEMEVLGLFTSDGELDEEILD